MNKTFPNARVSDLVVQQLPDEVLVYDLKKNKASCLNQSAAFIWQQCDGTKSVSEIASVISAHENEQIDEEFVWFALERLEQSELIDFGLERPTNSISRRKLILKSASLALALPLVTTLVAPHSIHAASAAAAACFSDIPNGIPVVPCTVGVTDCNADQGAGGVCTPGCSCGGSTCVPNGGSPCCTAETSLTCF